MPDWEPYVRIWQEQPSGREVAMLLADDYRRLCAVVKAVDAFDDMIAEFDLHEPAPELAEAYQRVHDALAVLRPMAATNEMEIRA